MGRSLRETGQVLEAAGAALGIYVLPWVLAVVGWSFSALGDALVVIEPPEPPAAVLLTLAPAPAEDPPAAEPPAIAAEEVVEDEAVPEPPRAAADRVLAVPARSGEGEAPVAEGGSAGRAERAPPPRRRRPSRCRDPHPNVRTGDDGVVEIDRALVDEVTRNLESFMQLGYSRPHDEDGVKGWYISGFSCASPVHKAGFRRGDVVLTVNGKKTRSWVGVYLMYQKLKKKDAFEVSLVRRGEPITLRFRVVERV